MAGTDKKTPKSALVLNPGEFGIFTRQASINEQRLDSGCYIQVVGHVDTEQGWRYQIQQVWIEEPWIRGKTIELNPSYVNVVVRLTSTQEKINREKTEGYLSTIPYEPVSIKDFKARSYYVRYPRIVLEAETYVVQADSPEEAAQIARDKGWHLKKLDERDIVADIGVVVENAASEISTFHHLPHNHFAGSDSIKDFVQLHATRQIKRDDRDWRITESAREGDNK